MALRLIIEDEEGATTIVPLGEEEVTIGREPGNTIQLTEQNVSRQHARLHQGTDGWVIEDLESYNGVKVNGIPISQPTLLREGDLIQIADYHLTLTDDIDRQTVDIERPRAANDDHHSMAGSSADLPSVSADDLTPSGDLVAAARTLREAFASADRKVPPTHLEERATATLAARRAYKEVEIWGARFVPVLLAQTGDATAVRSGYRPAMRTSRISLSSIIPDVPCA